MLEQGDLWAPTPAEWKADCKLGATLGSGAAGTVHVLSRKVSQPRHGLPRPNQRLTGIAWPAAAHEGAVGGLRDSIGDSMWTHMCGPDRGPFHPPGEAHGPLAPAGRGGRLRAQAAA